MLEGTFESLIFRHLRGGDELSNGTDPTGKLPTLFPGRRNFHRSVTITNGGTRVSDVPRGGFTGTDSFTYTVEDGNGGTATATVTVTVNKK